MADPSSVDVFWLALRQLFGDELEQLKGLDFDRDVAAATAVVEEIVESPEFSQLLVEYVRRRQNGL